MKWTTEKPTEPGWYWLRDKHGKLFVRRIDATPLKDLVVVSLIFQYPVADLTEVEYSGPIPEPEN